MTTVDATMIVVATITAMRIAGMTDVLVAQVEEAVAMVIEDTMAEIGDMEAGVAVAVGTATIEVMELEEEIVATTNVATVLAHRIGCKTTEIATTTAIPIDTALGAVETAMIHMEVLGPAIIVVVAKIETTEIGIEVLGEAVVDVEMDTAREVVVIISGIFGMATAAKIVAVAQAKPHQLHLITRPVRQGEDLLHLTKSTTKIM